MVLIPTPLLPSSPISARCNVSPLPLLTRWSSLTFSTCGLALLRTSNILHQLSCLNIKSPWGKSSHMSRLWGWGSFVVFSKPCFPITLLLFPFAAAVTVCCPPNYPWLLVSSVPYILAYFSSLNVRSIGPGMQFSSFVWLNFVPSISIVVLQIHIIFPSHFSLIKTALQRT